jgi:putative protease
MEQQQVGKVTNFYVKISVAAIEVTAGVIRIGDALHFKGHTTDFKDTVASMEMENQPVDEARPGNEVGIKVNERVRKNDRVYKVLIS